MDDVIWVPNNVVTRTLAEALESIVNPPLYRVDDAPGCGCYLEGAKIDGEYEDGLDVETSPVLRVQVSGIDLDDRDTYSEQDAAKIKALWDTLLPHCIPEHSEAPPITSTDTRLGSRPETSSCEHKGRSRMKERVVRVRFEGDVKVLVPDHLSDADADVLAEKLALARVVATTDNPDAPEEDACDEYLEEASGNASENDWDESSCETIGGSWSLIEQPRKITVADVRASEANGNRLKAIFSIEFGQLACISDDGTYDGLNDYFDEHAFAEDVPSLATDINYRIVGFGPDDNVLVEADFDTTEILDSLDAKAE